MKAERAQIISLISQAQASGAKQSLTCEIVGISPKTRQRWRKPDNVQDGRLDAVHEPANKLTALERQHILNVANEPEYANCSPNQIVPMLADQGIYIASESSFYRVLKAENQLNHRLNSKPARQIKKPRAFTATAPNQLYSWDITYLPTCVRDIFCTCIW